MSNLTKTGTLTNNVFLNGPSIGTIHPPNNSSRAGLVSGEAIALYDACYIKSDGKVWRALANINAAPAILTASSNASGTGLFSGSTVLLSATYVTAEGETTPSPPLPVTLTTTGQIRVSTFGSSLDSSILSANFYVNGMLVANTLVVSSAIPQTDITGSALTLAGTAPPTFNSAFKDRAYRVRGFAATIASSGDPVTLHDNVMVNYGSSLTPGADYWLGATAGALATTKIADTPVIAWAYDATRIWLEVCK